MLNAKRAIAALSFSLMFAGTALGAGSSVPYGMGGQVRFFAGIVSEYNRSGEPFRIEGHCQSACTMFLAIRNVCVTRSAELLFHAGKDRNRNVDASVTYQMFNTYNARLQAYITAHHYMDTLEFHTIPGRAIIDTFGYRECHK